MLLPQYSVKANILYKFVSIDKLISLQGLQRAEQDDTDGQALVLEERLAYGRQILLDVMAIMIGLH